MIVFGLPVHGSMSGLGNLGFNDALIWTVETDYTVYAHTHRHTQTHTMGVGEWTEGYRGRRGRVEEGNGGVDRGKGSDM